MSALMSASTEVSSRKHIPALDGVRAVAVLLVICFHFWQVFTYGPYSLVGKIAMWGQTGVDLFFVLSGFLITGILLDTKGSPSFLRNFYARRILRIFPLYYATLLTIYLIGPLFRWSAWVPEDQSLWFWTYLQNLPMTFAPGHVAGPEHFWSLAVEEQFYMVWPFLVLRLDRKRLLQVIAGAIGISLVTRGVFLHYQTFFFTLARLDSLAIGAALAVFARDQPEGLARFVPRSRKLLFGLGLTLAFTQLALSSMALPAIQIVKGTLISLVDASLLVLVIQGQVGRPMHKVLTGRFMGSIGKYSYGMYVLHPFILTWLHGMGLPYNAIGLAASVVVTYAAASVSWFVFEERFLRLKRYFESARPISLQLVRP